jgi:hypothetical protein
MARRLPRALFHRDSRSLCRRCRICTAFRSAKTGLISCGKLAHDAPHSSTMKNVYDWQSCTPSIAGPATENPILDFQVGESGAEFV